MDTTNMDARTSSTTASCSGTRTSRYTGTNCYNSRSATSTTKQLYSATIVPDAPKSGDHTDDYDDAKLAQTNTEQSQAMLRTLMEVMLRIGSNKA